MQPTIVRSNAPKTAQPKPPGNTRLVESGILTENSTLRAHVCVNALTVYVFPTKPMKELLLAEPDRFPMRSAKQEGVDVITATGWLVPVDQIPYMIPVNAKYPIQQQGFQEGMTTSALGDKAVAVVMALLRNGWFPLPCSPKLVENVQLQREGLDVLVTAAHRIQVKCDYRGGGTSAGRPKTTGNLFLQKTECNPLGRI